MDDPILIWNAVALEANAVNHTNGQERAETGPTRSSRALAIVHLAMYDAYASVDTASGLPNYLPPPTPPPAGATVKNAVAGAAFTALSQIFPSQLAFFLTQLQLYGDPTSASHAFGAAIADQLLDRRAGDPSASTGTYKPTKGRGRHDVDPDNPMQGFHGPTYGSAKLFATKVRLDLDAPPFNNGTSSKYKRSLRQVRGKGIKPELSGMLPVDFGNDKRNPEETVVGIFWAYDGALGLGTPPRLYNDIVRKIARAKGTSAADNAKLFAMVNVAMADAGILAWAEKYRYDFWRPVVGIREHDVSFGMLNPGQSMPAKERIDDDADSAWLPLGSPSSNSASMTVMTAQNMFPFANVQFGRVKNFTPPFPAYPSGHATFGAAAFQIARLFFGVPMSKRRKPDSVLDSLKDPDSPSDDIFFVSEELNEKTQDNNGTVRPLHRRTFEDGLWGMIKENGVSRVFLGVHWSFDAFDEDDADYSRKIGGINLGLRIAENIWDTGLTPSTV